MFKLYIEATTWHLHSFTFQAASVRSVHVILMSCLAAVNKDFLVVEARFHDRSQAEVVQTMCRTCTLQHGQVITKLQWIGHGYDIPRNDTIALPLE